LEVLEGKWGVKGSTAKGFKKFVETIGPEAYDDIVLRRNIAERRGWRARVRSRDYG
jgi:hypothetical protein